MTADEFRAALSAHGFATPEAPTGLWPFARWLQDRGMGASLPTIQRNVQRWAVNGPPGEIAVIFSLLDEQPRGRRRAA